MTRSEPIAAAERRARIDRMIEVYRQAKHQRLLKRATNLWRKIEARQRLVNFEALPERLH